MKMRRANTGVIGTVIVTVFLHFKSALGAYNETSINITPFSHSHRGAIGIGRICPPGRVAQGFRMKIQMPEDIDDL